MNTLDIKVYEIFKSHFNEQKAETLVAYIEDKAKEKAEERLEMRSKQFITQPDFYGIREEMSDLRVELKTDIANAKVDIIRWLIVTILGASGLIIAAIKLL